MQISVIGTGYVGLVTGTCFAEMGNNVICVDVVSEKIELLKQGKIPVYEPGLEEMVRKNYKNKNLEFTTDIKYALENSTICFIAVGTPMGEDGSADLQYVLGVAKEIGQYMRHPMYIVDKSTVPVGTADLVNEKIQNQLKNRCIDINFEVISNPEFLKEGTACQDFLKPDRVVIGSDDEIAIEVMRELYAPFLRASELFITMDIKSAELTKYAANSMLATKISFINEMANLCEIVGADINKVRMGIGSDHRIGYDFIYPGCGYGGSCFPKDVQALIRMGKEKGYNTCFLQAIENVNDFQKKVLVEKIRNVFGPKLLGCKFAVWGLSFKPETDDMREAPAITIIEELIYHGATIQAYDPKACEIAKKFYFKGNDKIIYFDNKYDALDKVDAMILVTEWKEFRSPDFNELALRMKNKIIFDGRNQYSMKKMKSLGFQYFQIGVQNL